MSRLLFFVLSTIFALSSAQAATPVERFQDFLERFNEAHKMKISFDRWIDLDAYRFDDEKNALIIELLETAEKEGINLLYEFPGAKRQFYTQKKYAGDGLEEHIQHMSDPGSNRVWAATKTKKTYGQPSLVISLDKQWTYRSLPKFGFFNPSPKVTAVNLIALTDRGLILFPSQNILQETSPSKKLKYKETKNNDWTTTVSGDKEFEKIVEAMSSYNKSAHMKLGLTQVAKKIEERSKQKKKYTQDRKPERKRQSRLK